MNLAKQIVFRRMTSADFFNIYKARGTEEKGGGQSYIDIDVSAVSIANWKKFFAPNRPTFNEKNFPAWNIEIHSPRIPETQFVKIGQRRNSTVSIRSQKLDSRQSNRVYAWHPDKTAFPRPQRSPQTATDIPLSLIEGLVIFIVRDSSDVFHAGWFQEPRPTFAAKDQRLQPLLQDNGGYIDLGTGLPFDDTVIGWPFEFITTNLSEQSTSVARKVVSPSVRKPRTTTQKSEDELLEDLFNEDEVVPASPEVEQKLQKVRVRNTAAVKPLKKLYGGRCQITGEEYIFTKPDGTPYTEAHHLIPLGKGGADSPFNLIVVSAHIHKMLHYANVGAVDLSRIKNNQLDIKINGATYTITWHPKHAEMLTKATANKTSSQE